MRKSIMIIIVCLGMIAAFIGGAVAAGEITPTKETLIVSPELKAELDTQGIKGFNMTNITCDNKECNMAKVNVTIKGQTYTFHFNAANKSSEYLTKAANDLLINELEKKFLKDEQVLVGPRELTIQ